LVKVIAIGVIKSCTCSYTRTLRSFIHRSCAYLGSLGKFGFRDKSGFKHKCRARAELGLQNETHLQLWFKPSMDSASLLVEMEKIFFRLEFAVFCG